MPKAPIDRSELILHEPKLYSAFWRLALPVCGANLLKALHDLVDTYFIGQMPDSVSAQAGISVSWPLINILMSFMAGLAVAGVAMISQLIGAGRKEEARKYSGLLLSLSLVLGVAINVLLYFLTPGVMRLMNAQGAVFDSAVVYTQTRSFEMIFLFIFAAFQAARQARGDTLTPVVLSVIAVVINIVLTAVFVRVLGWGVFGAAFATLIGNAAIAPACMVLLFRRGDDMRLRLPDLKLDRTRLKQLVHVALPSAGSQALTSFGFLILQGFILDYGANVAAAFSIGNRISNLLLIPILAVGSVMAAGIGQNIGASNSQRALQSYRVGRNIGFVVTIVGCLLILPIRQMLINLLTNDGQTQAITMEYLIFILITQPLMAQFQSYISVFNGSGRTRFSFIMSISRLWLLRLPMILLFKNFTDLGRGGIWYAMLLSNLLILIVGRLLFRRLDFVPAIENNPAARERQDACAP